MMLWKYSHGVISKKLLKGEGSLHILFYLLSLSNKTFLKILANIKYHITIRNNITSHHPALVTSHRRLNLCFKECYVCKTTQHSNINKGVCVGMWASVTACLSVALHVNCCYCQSPWGKTGIIKVLASIHLGWWDIMMEKCWKKQELKKTSAPWHTQQSGVSYTPSLNLRVIDLKQPKRHT